MFDSTIDALAALHGDVAVMPTSFAQQRFWLLDQLTGDTAAYTVPLALRLRGALDASALARALAALVERHESLRTVFALDGGEPVQVILPSVDVPLPAEDLRALDAETRRATVDARVAANANAGFDLSAGPLVRASLLRTADDEHVLLVALHHVIADGWSVGVLLDELGRAYGDVVAGRSPSFAALPLQYADFAVWQRENMADDAASKQLAYWTDALRDAPTLELSTDRPRPAVQSLAGGKRELAIPLQLMDAVRALGRRERATPYMVFLAGFAALLYRYTGQSDLVVGSITSGRRRPELEPLIGLFVNTLAVRVDVDGAASFTRLLGAVRERATAAFEHQDVPFERVVDAVQPARDRARSPIFQAAFQLFEGLAREPQMPGLAVERVSGIKDSSKFDLTLMLHANVDGSARAVMEYASALFDASTVDRMLAHYARLLEGIARDASTPVDRLPLLDTAEDALVTEHWNDTAAPLPAWTTPRRVLEIAARSPDAVAVRAGDEMLTYAQLDAHSAALSRRLVANGVTRGDRVAVCMERSASLLVALLAVHRAGAAYVPLDPAYPAERIAHVLEDAGVRVVLTDAVAAASLPETTALVLFVSSTDDTDDTDRGNVPLSVSSVSSVDENDLAYVIYTSGSTGKPKGVMIPHVALANFLATMSERPSLAAGDAIVAVTTISFDIAGLELWLPLVTGAEVVLASREVAIDGVALRALVERTGAECAARGRRVMLQATPATWRLLVEAGWEGTSNLVMLCGGEAWPPRLAESLVARGAALWNVYGPTETTIWSTRDRVREPDQLSLGEPLANTTLYVLEPTGGPAPLGVPGELWIGGAGLAVGYHNRDDLTRERFVAHPRFGRIYRTGDRVRRRADGRLEYLGRLDDQIKVRGYRIELGEIESVLATAPGVKQAAVALRTVGGEPRLVAYVVPGADVPNDSAEHNGVLAERLRRALPEYMVPSAIVRLDAMPLTPNGKVNRRALPAPAQDDATAARAHVAPRTPLESQIATIWAEVLGVERVSVEDDFFALGGHSLLAMRVIGRLADAVPARLTIGAMFEARTVAGLAALAVQRMADAEAAAAEEDLAALLAELDGLTEEEAARLLAEDTTEEA